MPSFGCISPSTKVQFPCTKDNLQAAKIGTVLNGMDVIFTCKTYVIHWIAKMKYHGECFVCLYQELLTLSTISAL